MQKKIWLEVGGKVDYETECKLGDRVGWRKGGSWLNYDDLTFNKQAQAGHHPVLWGRGVVVVERMGMGWCEVLGGVLLSHREL